MRAWACLAALVLVGCGAMEEEDTTPWVGEYRLVGLYADATGLGHMEYSVIGSCKMTVSAIDTQWYQVVLQQACSGKDTQGNTFPLSGNIKTEWMVNGAGMITDVRGVESSSTGDTTSGVTLTGVDRSFSSNRFTMVTSAIVNDISVRYTYIYER